MVSLLTTVMVAGALTREDSALDAVTTTSSPRRAIFIVVDGTSTGAPATVTSLLSLEKPMRVTVTLCVPSGTPVKVYLPSLFVVANLLAPGPVSWTFAPGTGAPDSSTTVPVTVPPAVWGRAGTVETSSIESARNRGLMRRSVIRPPPAMSKRCGVNGDGIPHTKLGGNVGDPPWASL